ncbi:MAG: c-type cytochrome [Actinomycetota bacterium]
MIEDLDDGHDVDAVDFVPAVSATGAETNSPSLPPRPRRWRRRFAGALVLATALTSMGGIYAAFASSSGASDNTTSQADIDAGRRLYETSCITCHGANLQGVEGRGVPIAGAGSAAAYFQISTGRMPLARQGAQALRGTPKFTQDEIDKLAAYVQSVGGGPVVPDGDLRKNDVGLGKAGDLFRLNCAQCHGFSGKGGALSAGKIAPSLTQATDAQVYAAMVSGPENMPVFNDNQLTPEQKKAIVDYVRTLGDSKDPGGSGLDRIGPVSEGLVVWLFGIGALVITILWIGAKS